MRFGGQEIRDYLKTQNQPIPMPNSNIRWCHPPVGYYKLNVDVAGPSEQGKWGIVVVIRDADGLVAAASWCLPISQTLMLRKRWLC
jgi:hypothetical protein